MVEYVAVSQNWEMLEVKIYIGRVEDSSVANNRLVSINILFVEYVVHFHKTLLY